MSQRGYEDLNPVQHSISQLQDGPRRVTFCQTVKLRKEAKALVYLNCLPKAALLAQSTQKVETGCWLKQRHHVVPRSVLARKTVPAALKAGCPQAGAFDSTKGPACSPRISLHGSCSS
jgi:hypothetical protein